ncbi:hypothetical protein Thpro_021620 [Acidihalobacter prosperus]|uniref:Uncharacterized protein n=2 Tax=Acidihalobacter prosperus TaxID=160660 RepID=A0A1A6C3Z9_9GAMM|nr:hypothetical protein Thpro_021620 [Acidihalobacter prosperus]
MFLAVALVLSALFATASLEGLRAMPAAPTGPQIGWESQDHTIHMQAKGYLLSTGMLLKWMMADVAVLLGAVEIALALTLYLRALARGVAEPMPGRRRVPNILRSADRRYVHEQLPLETASAYQTLSGLALGSAIIAGFLVADNATWIIAAMFSGNW